MVAQKNGFFIMLLLVALVLAACQPVQDSAENATKIWYPENITIDTSPQAPSENTVMVGDTAEVITITINETQQVNLKPVVEAREGLPVSFTFSAPLDANGVWQTKVGDAGEYLITITATDGLTTDSRKVLLLVRSLNRPPVLGKLDDVTVHEGETVSFSPVAVDPDGDDITITYSGFMETSSYTTKYGDAGEYIETITVSDGRFTDSKRVKVKVLKTNRPPVLKPILDVTVIEGDQVVVKPQAIDPDNDAVSYVFTAPLTSDGVWQTAAGDAGTYKVNVTATDGKLSDTKSIFILVSRRNKAPVLASIESKTVKENEPLSFSVSAVDPDNDPLSYSVFGLPEGAGFEGAKFTWKPTYETVPAKDASRDFKVTFIVSDGQMTDSKVATITVVNVPRPIQIVDVKQG